MEQLIFKNQSEIKDISDEGIISGYANVYNVKDSQGDISDFGSFAKTVTERRNKIRIFKNHTPVLVGVPTEMNISDPYGLYTVIKMLLNTDAGKDTYQEVKFLHENGFESGMSIAGWATKRDATQKSRVKEYKLREISVLTTDDPANDLSLIDAVKSVNSLSQPTQQEFWTLIEKAYNQRFSDPMLKSFEEFLTLKNKQPEDIDLTTADIKPSPIILDIYNQIKNL